MVRYGAQVAVTRPHTRDYPEEARARLGVAATRAREALGHPKRPAFARLASISVRSLFKLENGDPVGPSVYEAVARQIPNWDEDTPVGILGGGEVPPTASAPAEPPPPILSDDELIALSSRELSHWFIKLADTYSPRAAEDAMLRALDVRKKARAAERGTLATGA